MHSKYVYRLTYSCGMRCLQLAGPQTQKQNKTPVNLLKEKSAFTPKSVCSEKV